MCWCLCAALAAQTPVIDSLEHVLASGELKKREKAELLKNLANAYSSVDTAKCRKYALETIKLSQSIGYKKMEASAYIALATIYYPNGDPEKFIKYNMEALKIAQANEGLELQEGIVQIYLGNHYLAADQYYLSHDHYKKAEKLLTKLNDKKRLTQLYRNLTLVFDQIHDDENIVYYANLLKEAAEGSGNYSETLLAELALATVKYRNNNAEALEPFLDLYQKSIPLNNIHTAMLATHCGELYMLLNRPREALYYLHRVNDKAQDFGNSSLRIQSAKKVFLAEAYAMLHQTDSAKYHLEKVQETPFIDYVDKPTIYRISSMLDADRGDYRSALENYKKFHHLSDSIAKSQKTTEIARMKNWHELEQKDNENYLLQQEQQKQQKLIRTLTGALMLIVILLALSVFLYRKTAEKNRELKQLHTVKDKLFSVVAHDLRSPMGALMSMLNLANENELDSETLTQLLKDISARVDDTYSLLDNLLHWSRSQMQGMTPAPVVFDAQDGSRAVTDSLQSIAAHKNIILNNRIAKQQIYADRDMFAVVVRNLTMNAIKYTPEVGEITLASELKDNMLIISVKDNGTGMTQEVQDKLFKLSETRSKRGTNNESGTGLGLVLCADFVKINGGDIWFTSVQDEGSTFYFSIRINK